MTSSNADNQKEEGGKILVPRINQLDAATLDEEIFTSFNKKLSDAFKYFLRFLDMHMYVTSALQRTDMKAVGLQLALDLLHEKVRKYASVFIYGNSNLSSKRQIYQNRHNIK